MSQWVALILVFVSAFAYAGSDSESCPTIHLWEKGGPMQDIAITDQGQTPNCFIHATETLIRAAQPLSSPLRKQNFLPPQKLYQEILKRTDNERILSAEASRICATADLIQSLIDVEGRFEYSQCQKFDFVHPAGLKAGKKELHSPAEFVQELHRLLEMPAPLVQPIGIEYCSGVLGKSKKSTQACIHNRIFDENVDYLNSSREAENFDGLCGFHDSVVVGQEKRKDGRCYFIIHNSWGKDCRGYAPGSCKRGRYYVPSESLAKNIVRLVHW